MANKRPSFLKRQKEQARLTRAAEKRADRAARRQAKSARGGEPEPVESVTGAGASTLAEAVADAVAEAAAPPEEEVRV